MRTINIAILLGIVTMMRRGGHWPRPSRQLQRCPVGLCGIEAR